MESKGDIKELLKERGITIAKFTDLGNFSRSTAFRVLNGKRPLSTLERLGLESLPKKRGRKPGKKYNTGEQA